MNKEHATRDPEKKRSKHEIHAVITGETSRDAVIRLLADEMASFGMVDASYGESVLERERSYPTGVPTEPVAVAIPHSERIQVSKTGIGVAVLTNSAKFASIDAPENLLDVKVVFMLAISSDDGHLDIIQDIMGIIQDRHVVDSLLTAGTPGKIEEIMHRELTARENKR